jgi:hypothetical protein
MNNIPLLERFAELSLAAGGSHYPNVNAALQQRFGEMVVQQCCKILTDNVEVALDASGNPVYPEALIRKHFGLSDQM